MGVAKFVCVSRKACLALFVGGVACAAHAQSDENIRLAAAQPMALKFDWGDSLDANVVAIREEVVTKGNSERASKLEARFRLHAAREGERYALTFSDLRMTLDGAPLPESAQPAMLGPVTGLVLSYDVTKNGDFVGLRDFARLQSFTEQNYLAQNSRLRPEERPSQKHSDQALKAGTSREVLQLDSSRTWGALAGLWSGLKLTEGKPLVSDSAVTVPVINAPLTLRSSFLAVRREECAESERKRSCVRLRATTRPDPGQLAAAVERLKQSTGSAEPTTGAMNVEDRIELLTDPDTLKPRWAEWTRGADLSGVQDGKDRVVGQQSTKTTMTFDYSLKR